MGTKTDLLDLRRHNRPTVVISGITSYALIDALLIRADKMGWQLRELEHPNYSIPTDPGPIGALVGCWPSHPLCRELLESGCPVVRVASAPEAPPQKLPSVIIDQESAGIVAAGYYADQGYSDIGYVGNTPWGDAKVIYDGLVKGAKRHGIHLHLLQVDPRGTRGETFKDRLAREEEKGRQISSWLAAVPKPIGLVGYNDFFATRLCVIAQSIGLAIPEEVAIMGVQNNVRACEMAPVSLSSIPFDACEQVRQAARLLQSIIDGEPPPEEPIWIPATHVVERHSTNILAVKDKRVARALRFMWDNLDSQLSVEDIAHEVGVSRSTINRLFMSDLGRGVNAELHRKRLEHCCQLLKTTDMTVKEITKAIGFMSKTYLHRAFLKAFGVTPAAYRADPATVAQGEGSV